MINSRESTKPLAIARTPIPIEHCKLYGQSSRKRLIALLGWNGDVASLERFANRDDNYQPFRKKKPGGKSRMVEPPKPGLKKLHEKLFRCIRDIRTPAYLHSGVRKRSYPTNAKAHVAANDATIAMDLSNFYSDTKWGHLFRFFREDLKCSPDFSGLLARLCCYQGHLPTGSPISQVLAFFAHQRMFDEIEQLVAKRGGVFTVYVDDLTITMRCASHSDVETVRSIVERHGMSINAGKTHVYRARSAKTITGAILLNRGMRAAHVKHRKLQSLRAECGGSDVSPELLGKLVGTLEHVALLDERLAPKLRAEARGLRRVASDKKSS